MKRWMFALAAMGAFLTAGVAVAEHGDGRMRHGMMNMLERFSPEDRDAFTDARLAGLRAGLKLSPDQDKLWPPVEEAIRGLINLRRDQARAWRESRDAGRDDIPGLLRGMADRQTARADALRKLADAAAPLYASLDEGQKRRLKVLAHTLRPHFGAMHHAMRDEGDRRRPADE